MAQKTEIELVIAPNGEVKFRVTGGPPEACQAMAAKLSASLGPIIKEERTGAHYHAPQEQDRPSNESR